MSQIPTARSPIARRSALVMLLAAILAACGGGASPSAPVATGLPEGTYASAGFQPAVTFSLPDGWTIPADRADYLLIAPAGSEVVGIHLFRDPLAAMQDVDCTKAAESNVGSTSGELSVWLRGLPGFTTSPPSLVTIGGLRGVSLDLGIAADWTGVCPFAEGLPTVPFITSPKGGYHWVIAGEERLRIYILDVPGGGTVLVDIDDFTGDFIDDLIADAEPIVRSFTFAVE